MRLLKVTKKMKILKYVVKKPFTDFLPDPGDFEIRSEKYPPKLEKGQFLVKAQYISADPYLRSFANKRIAPYEQFGFQVGKVLESTNPEYPVTMTVVSHSGWRDFTVLNGEPDEMFGIKPYDPQVGDLPLSLTVGALGMPGITAYLGLLQICKPRAGEVVCVSSAAGAVGSIVGQIANKLMGCIVIGFAGSDEKVRILTQELGFHHAFNYKTVKDVKRAIFSVSNGIDCYFDNVGGDLSVAIMKCMRKDGRVAVCGSISTYGNEQKKVPTIPDTVNVQAFSFTQWDWQEQKAAIQQIKEWIERGFIIVKESITNGFENLPGTFIAMLRGDGIGKVVVKL